MESFDLTFDNGGGITLQTAKYCHHFYGRATAAAQCVSDLLNPGAMPDCWDNNEPEHRIEYDYDAERAGQYHWVSDNDVMEAVGQIHKEDRNDFLDGTQGLAEREFFEALFALRDELHLQQ